MGYVDRHSWPADVAFDGGTLDCGNGLLLLIRKHIDPLRSGELLEIRSQESSVVEDLPAWCRLTKNELVSCTRPGARKWSFLVCKGALARPAAGGHIDAAIAPTRARHRAFRCLCRRVPN